VIVVRNEVLVRQAGGRAGYRNRRPDGTHPNESQGRRSCEVLRHTVLHDGFQIGHVVVPTSRGRRGLCKAANSFRAIQKFMKSRPAGGDYGNRSDYTRAKGKSKRTQVPALVSAVVLDRCKAQVGGQARDRPRSYAQRPFSPLRDCKPGNSASQACRSMRAFLRVTRSCGVAGIVYC
jgi:hypothetical protein